MWLCVLLGEMEMGELEMGELEMGELVGRWVDG